tara:strand:+ start:108 stop:569 length:462 start_codon:yes stop_codon:yes gene_type:complete
MPNWCHNRVSFYSDNEQEISDLYEIFESDEVFQKILPAPDWKNTPNDKGELPVKREHKNPDGKVVYTTYDFPDGQNDDRWYSWNVNNWGTKWEIGRDSIECDHFDGCSFECEFETAWSPPEGIYQALREQYPDVSISWFFDEPGMQVAGYLNN